MTLFKEQSKFKKIELIQKVSDVIPTQVFADPKRIKQILMNMMSNALKFTSEGWISVSFDMDDLPASHRSAALTRNRSSQSVFKE